MALLPARHATVRVVPPFSVSPDPLFLTAPPITGRTGRPAWASRPLLRVSPASASASASRLAGVEQAPPDPILGVSDAFRACTHPDKLNLGVGAYRTEDLKPYVLDVVREVETNLLTKAEDHEYLPIDGLAAFNAASIQLLLGEDHPAVREGRVTAIQSLSGTGSLRVGAAFVQAWLPGAEAYISNPTWGNHRNIFADAGVAWHYYKYYDPETIGLDFDGMKDDLRRAPDGSVVVLHGCAHNPTGIDPTAAQWEEIADLCQEKKHLPFFDVAYQVRLRWQVEVGRWWVG